MDSPTTFNDLLNAVEMLPEDEQLALTEIIRRRLAEKGRRRLVEDVQQARREFAEGKCRVATVDEIMREIME